ncbi:MAG: glycosyltransferase family 2 protein [Calditrichaceae bacterium]
MMKITVVIPHFNGIEILRNSFKEFTTLVIDNGSTDGSQDFVHKEFPQVKLIENQKNLGFAGGCNQGMRLSTTPYILLLNNDTEMPDNFLADMLNAIEKDGKIAMVQPKILSIQEKSMFDYSGGAGGELDIFGYPFARGRIFDDVEKDNKQYDKMDENCFWTSGCALLLRKSVIDEIGYLDEDFFAHQEEIDLNWRAFLAGYRNIVTTKTFIYHYSGYTLRSDNQRKMFLNHRNNVIMMIKNYSLLWLMLLLPVRIVLEFITVAADYFLWEGYRAKAVLQALIDIFRNIGSIIEKRKDIQKLRRVPDRKILKNMYKGSIVFAHFIRRKKPNQCVSAFRN